MNLLQETNSGLECSLTLKNMYLVISSTRLLNLTNKKDKTHYIQMRFLTNYGIS